MRRRVLSLVLAIAMCFSVVSVALANDDMTLMGTPLGDLMNNYRDRLWDWQTNQFGAMTADQLMVIEEAWNAYDTDEMRSQIKEVAEDLAEQIVTESFVDKGLEDTEEGEDGTLKNLYKWKLMRDMADVVGDDGEHVLDVTSADDRYATWLDVFKAFEEANDDSVSAEEPRIALDNVDDYAAELVQHFGELVILIEHDGVVLEGEDADKVNLYIDAFMTEVTDDEYPEGFKEELVKDARELLVDGMVNAFDFGMRIATNQVNQEETNGLFKEVRDRDMKASFLLFGVDYVEYAIDEMESLRDDFLGMEKTALISSVAGANGLDIISGNNDKAVAAIYSVINAVGEYVEAEPFMADHIAKAAEIGLDTATVREATVAALEEAMGKIDSNHAIELVHFNTFLGREMLRYKDGEDLPKLSGAEFDAADTSVIELAFAHDRYPAFEAALKNLDLAQFDVEGEGDGINVYVPIDNPETDLEFDGPIGVINVEAAEEADGTITVDVFRGYTDDEPDGTEDFAEDVYRYVTSFTVKAVSDVEAPEVELIYEANPETGRVEVALGEAIRVVGTTNLDYVTISVVIGSENKWVKTVDKATFESGVEVPAIDNAQVGDIYTITVGTDEAFDSYEIEIVEKAPEVKLIYEVNPETGRAEVLLGETIKVAGTTNLDYVTISVVIGSENKWVKTVDKATFESGVEVPAIDNAQIGDIYTITAGTDEAFDSYEIEIVEKVYEAPEVELIYEVNPETGRAEVLLGETIKVVGTTNLDYVTISVVMGNENKWVKTVDKATFESGVEVPAIDNAQVGNIYTITAGTDEAFDSYEIEIVEKVYEAPEVELIYEVNPETGRVEVLLGETIKVVGTTNLDYVTISVVMGNENKWVKTVDKATFESGVEVPAIDNAQVGDIYTITAGTDEAFDSYEIEIVEKAAEYKLNLAGDNDGDGVDDRTVTKGSTINIQTTPQFPAGVTNAKVVWEIVNADGEVAVVKVAGDYNNILQIKGITVGKGVVITATLYIDDAPTDAKVTINVTVKKKSSSGGPGVIITPTEEPTKDDEDTKPHSCEWPDIAATTTKSAHWAHLTIDQMTTNGYIAGYPDGTFKPDELITRAEFATIVYRILALQNAEDGVKYDDTVGHWAEDIIGTMSLPEGYGMLRGYGDGNFGPEDNITREQAVAIIARAKSAIWVEATEGAKDVFTDAELISWWFDGEMDAAVTNGLITGYEDGSYKPLGFTTRAEACVLLARAWPEVLD